MRLIDADKLKEAIKSDIYVVDYGVEGAIYGMFWSGIENAIDEQPTVEQKTGKWIHGRELSREMIGDCIIAIRYDGWKCSECDCLVEEKREPLYKFCPNCGAKMEA